MTQVEKLAQEFVCARCGHQGGYVEKLSMSGTGISKFLDLESYDYGFISCRGCGYTEVYNLRILEGKK